jgi:hypothetical protein
LQRYSLRPLASHRPHVSLSAGFPGSLGFLGNPSPAGYPVDTFSSRRTRPGYSVPGYRLPWRVGPHCSPGDVLGCNLEHAISVQPERLPSRVSMSILDQADNLRRLAIPNDDSAVSSSAYPCSTLLGGMRREILRDRLSFPLHGLRVSRYRGERASPLHQGERNYTSTTSKLSKTSAVLAPQLRCFHLSRERIAGRRGRDRPIFL